MKSNLDWDVWLGWWATSVMSHYNFSKYHALYKYISWSLLSLVLDTISPYQPTTLYERAEAKYSTRATGKWRLVTLENIFKANWRIMNSQFFVATFEVTINEVLTCATIYLSGVTRLLHYLWRTSQWEAGRALGAGRLLLSVSWSYQAVTRALLQRWEH